MSNRENIFWVLDHMGHEGEQCREYKIESSGCCTCCCFCFWGLESEKEERELKEDVRVVVRGEGCGE